MTKTTGRFRSRRRSRESGQAALFLLLALGLFLLGGVGLAVDMADLWMHRQASQNAADAACTAAAMDMVNDNNSAITNSGGFTPGTAFNCSASGNNSSVAPCQYAAFNGYSATGLTAGSPSTEVAISFPSSVAGVQTCSGNPPPSVCTQTGFPTTAFVRATVTDRTRTFLIGLLSGGTTMDVGASASCGAVLSNAPIPLLILNPTVSGSLSGNGNINISIVGGPQRSIQVDSSSATAVSIAGNSNTIDLSHGGQSNTGSDYGITGVEPKSSAGNMLLGSTGNYLAPTAAISDPFATLAYPSTVPGAPVPPSDLTAAQCPSIPCSVPTGTHGCQDTTCQLYTGGHYTSDIVSFKQTLIFDPGLYYMDANLIADQQSCLRPSTGLGDGSGGSMFYFNGLNTVNVTANAGSWGVCGNLAIKVPLTAVKCINSGTGATQLPANVVTQGGLIGNVLLGPCQAPTAGGTNYGDPLGTNDPLGEQRGMVFFQDRSANLAGAKKAQQPSWGGGGGFGLSGIMYFHYCNSLDGAHLGTNCASAAYTDQLSLQGGSSSSTFVIGDVVTDELSLGGNPGIEMDLNPNALYYVLKASLLQ